MTRATGALRADCASTMSTSTISISARAGFEAWNASFGAHAHVGDHMFFGVSIARTARAPTDLELFADGPHPATAQYEVGDDALDVEEGVNTEVSARWEDDAFNLSATAYQLRLRQLHLS